MINRTRFYFSRYVKIPTDVRENANFVTYSLFVVRVRRCTRYYFVGYVVRPQQMDDDDRVYRAARRYPYRRIPGHVYRII